MSNRSRVIAMDTFAADRDGQPPDILKWMRRILDGSAILRNMIEDLNGLHIPLLHSKKISETTPDYKYNILHCIVLSGCMYPRNDVIGFTSTLFIKLGDDEKQKLLNGTNDAKETPLHMAAQCNEFGLLNLFASQVKVDINFLSKRPTALHFLASAESPDAVESMRKLLSPQFENDEARNKFNDEVEKVKEECSEISAVHGTKDLLTFFVEEKILISGTTSEQKKVFTCNLLSFVAQGFNDSCTECLKYLLTQLSINSPHQYHIFFNDTGVRGGFGILQTACEAKNTKMVSAMLPVIETYNKWSPKWFTSETLKLLYTHCPSVLLEFMNNSFNLHVRPGSEKPDIIVEINLQSIISTDAHPFRQTDAIASIASCDDQETKNEILLHPLTRFYVKERWKAVFVLAVLSSIFQIFFTVSLNTLIIRFFVLPGSGKITKEFWDTLALISLIKTTVVFILKEILQTCCETRSPMLEYEIKKSSDKTKPWLSKKNLTQLLVIITAVIVCTCVICFPNCQSTCQELPLVWLVMIGSLASCVLFTVDMGRIWGFERYSELLRQVLLTSCKILGYYLPLLIGFVILFMAQTRLSHSDWFQMPQGLIKILVMAGGELDYQGFYDAADINNSAWSKLFFLVSVFMFILVVIIALINVLIALAVFDLEILLRNAESREIESKLILIAEYERFISSIIRGDVITALSANSWEKKLIAKRLLAQIYQNRSLNVLPPSIRKPILILIATSKRHKNAKKEVQTEAAREDPIKSVQNTVKTGRGHSHTI